MKNVLEEALPIIFANKFSMVKYERPRIELEKLKKILYVKMYRKIAEITYEEYLRRKNIKL